MNPLLSRLRVAGRALLDDSQHPQPGLDEAAEASCWAGAIARFVRGSRLDEHLWLAIVAFTTVFPTLDEHVAVRRRVALATPGGELDALLSSLTPIAARAASLDSAIELVANAVVIDADFSGRSDHNTGVQRVLRETVSRWATRHELVLAAWNDDATAMRSLTGREPHRVLDWPEHSRRSAAGLGPDIAADEAGRPGQPLLVPVDSVVVEIEVAQVATAAPLAALAAVSGNRVALVGHDMIPIVSAQSQEPGEIERFARFLTVVKNADRLAGVSASAAAEFTGFTTSLSAQGVPGPTVLTIPLAMNAPSLAGALGVASGATVGPAAAATAAADTAGVEVTPLIVVVGSQEPRKNHFAILFAAERLWKAGERFRLRFIGGGAARHLRWFDAEIARLRADGRPVEVLRGAGDDVLVTSYADARFTVFPSLHEGFGLPVAESLALGTPVITSDHGSLAEAASGGGCLQVDARDDEALAVAMTSLLHDDELYERLRGEALTRSSRTWNDYSAELWTGLVEPLLSTVEPLLAPSHSVTPDAPSGAARAAATPEPTPAADVLEPAPADASRDQRTLEAWWLETAQALAERRARERSLIRKASKVVPLARFFVARSREMGVVPAGKAAVRIVKRRLTSG